MRIAYKAFVFVVIGVIILIAYVQSSLIFKSVGILSGIFSEEESIFFGLQKPEEVALDGTRLYIFKPDGGNHPAIIFSLGLWQSGNDTRLAKPVETLVNSGFVVLLVESKDTRDGFITEGGIKSLVAGFDYLQKQDYVEKDKIGFLGISIGSSLVFIAAASPEISEDVLFILWLGGYYDVIDYIIDVFSESISYEGKIIEYKTDSKIKETVLKNLVAYDEKLAESIISTKNRNELRELLDASASKEKLDALSPKNYVSEVKAKIFVIHDRSDKLVPFTESIHLNEEKELESFVLTEIITHAVPEIDLETIQAVEEYIKLIFLTKDILMLVEN